MLRWYQYQRDFRGIVATALNNPGPGADSPQGTKF